MKRINEWYPCFSFQVMSLRLLPQKYYTPHVSWRILFRFHTCPAECAPNFMVANCVCSVHNVLFVKGAYRGSAGQSGERFVWQSELSQLIPWNSIESDLGCTSRINFDSVTLKLYDVTLTSHKPCQPNNKCNCSKTNEYK